MSDPTMPTYFARAYAEAFPDRLPDYIAEHSAPEHERGPLGVTEIPDDIMEAARKAHAEFADSRCRDNLGTIIARALLAERMAERDRCVKLLDVARSNADVTLDDIAAAIRKG